jgi:hypothetical protein
MSQTRNKTLIQHLGFNDPDLKSPAHDSLVLWIADNVQSYVEKKSRDPWQYLPEGIEEVKAAIAEQIKLYEREIEFTRDRLESDRDSLSRTSRDSDRPLYVNRIQSRETELASYTDSLSEVDKLQRREIPIPTAAPPPRVETKFEVPITTNRDFIVGFIDVVASVGYPFLKAVGITRYNNGFGKPSGLKGLNPSVEFGFGDFETLYFEAKPKIQSLGELLRQINTYKTYVADRHNSRDVCRFVVVSPDTRFRSAIEGQGIEFWESPEL